ncbi:MAG: TonB-dependent receptor [Gemmatimonadales bacterium]
MVGSTILAVVALAGSPGRDSVYGAVHDAVSGARVSGVRVEAEAAEPVTVSSQEGTYSVPAGSAGEQQLRFSRDGYEDLLLTVSIPPGASIRVDVELDPRPLPLPSLEVAGKRAEGRFTLPDRDSFEIGLRRLVTDSLPFDPLVVGDDPFLAGGTGPESGAQSGLPSSIHIRGGSSDQNLVLLEGLPVYGTTHLGGAASLFDPEAVASVDLHSAVPPAHLGGRLSSTINVHLRPAPSGFGFRGAADPTSVRQTMAGSVAGGAGTILLSGRQSYRGVFAHDGDNSRTNDFHDLLGRGSLRLERDDIALYLLQSSDHLAFPTAGNPATGNNIDQPTNEIHHRFSWASTTGGAVWTHSGRPGTTLTTRLWRASSQAQIHWAVNEGPAQVESGLEDVGFSSDLVSGSRSKQHRVGVAVQRVSSLYEISPIGVTAGGAVPAPVRLQSAPTILSAFAQEQRSIGRRLTLSTGLRASAVNAANLLLEPRLSLRYRLSGGVTLSAGAARIHQFLQSMRNEESLLDRAFGPDLPITVGVGGLPPARADQISAAVETRLSPALTLSLDGYLRHFTGLLVTPATTASPFSPGMPPIGSGRAGGLTLDGRYRSGPLEVRANFGLARSTRSTGSLEYSPGALRSRWLAVGVIRRLGDLTSVRLASTLASGGATSILGGPIEWQSPGGWAGSGEIAGSPDQILGPLNAARLPTYLRTDLGLTRNWRITAGEDGLLTTTLTITNLFDRQNPLGYVAATGSPTPRTLLFSPRSLSMQVGWHF